MVILDSNIIIYLSKSLIDIDRVFKSDEIYAVSVISYMEVLGYDFKTQEEEEFIKKLFSYLNIIYLDDKIANETIKLKKLYKIKLPDAIICASAIVNNAKLITNDKRLENMEELNIEILEV